MKTYCKPREINIEDINLIQRGVFLAFDGKLRKRRDFQRLLVSTGAITRRQLREELESGSRNRINRALIALAEDVRADIIARHLNCPPLRPFRRRDECSGKVRDLCRENAYQQCCEYIAVQALMPLFRARLLPCQYGSIPGRGQVRGARKIQRILRRHPGPVTAIKSDVRKAYPSTKVAVVMGLLARDIRKNGPLLWFVGAVMANYPGGALVIGGYLSTWLFNYVMAGILRQLLGSGRIRRGKRIRDVWAAVSYADDTVIVGTRSGLFRAMRGAARWAAGLGLNLKPCWLVLHIPPLAEERENHRRRQMGSRKRTVGVDMMGYVVRRLCIIVRRRIWRRMRRRLLRARQELRETGALSWRRGAQLSSCKGWLLHSNGRCVWASYGAVELFRAAAEAVANWQRRGLKCERFTTSGQRRYRFA